MQQQLLRSALVSVTALGTLAFYLAIALLLGINIYGWFMVVLATGWLVICFSAYRWLGPLLLATWRVRKPILEEEEWLAPIQYALEGACAMNIPPVLYILEQPTLGAYALGRNIVMLTRGLIAHLNIAEIQAVLAHEYGHLKHGDTRMSVAFSISLLPLKLFHAALMKAVKIMRLGRYRFFSLALILTVVLLAALTQGGLLIILIFGIFMLSFPIIHWLIELVWCRVQRSDEFRQDAFAQSIGCGKALKSALLKIDALDSGNLVSRTLELRDRHPMLYRRVRRLEWLEGQRATP